MSDLVVLRVKREVRLTRWRLVPRDAPLERNGQTILMNIKCLYKLRTYLVWGDLSKRLFALLLLTPILGTGRLSA